MNDIVMPKLSDTMTEGRLVSWKKQVGETVRRGDVLAEVETDKANMELEAFTPGVLLEIRVQAGELAQVGTVIAVIGSAEEKGAAPAHPEAAAPKAAPPEAPAAAAQPEPAGGAVQAEPVAAAPKEQPAATAAAQGAKPQASAAVGAAGAGAPASAQSPAEEQAPTKTAAATNPQAAPEAQAPVEAQTPVENVAPVEAQAPANQTPAEPQTPTEALPPTPSQATIATQAAPSAPQSAEPGAAVPVSEAASPAAPGVRAAPVVRRRARELRVDLGQVQGSGPEGRILLHDLEGQQAAQPGPVTPAKPEGATSPAATQTMPLSRLRSAIARTVAESWRTMPHFSVTADVVMDEAEAVRRQLKGSGIAVTLNDLVVKGVSLALGKFPRLNATFAGESIELHGEINIGIAVGVPDGVLVPVIPACQTLSLQQIAGGARQLVDLARSGGLSEQQMSGGTFSVSNLGMYGVSQFSAIIYPSQAAVLAVGAVSDSVIAHSGVPVCARLMKLTLSADHRVVDGAYAAEFLAELKDTLENPVRLLI